VPVRLCAEIASEIIRLINIPDVRSPRKRKLASYRGTRWHPAVEDAHRNSGLTSRNSTRFIASTQTSLALAHFATRQLQLPLYAAMTQEPNSSHSLAPLGYPSAPKKAWRALPTSSSSLCPHRLLLPAPLLAISPRVVLLRRCRSVSSSLPSLLTGVPGTKQAGLGKTGEVFAAPVNQTSDGFAPILMMIHCSISPGSRPPLPPPRGTAR